MDEVKEARKLARLAERLAVKLQSATAQTYAYVATYLNELEFEARDLANCAELARMMALHLGIKLEEKCQNQ